MRKLIQILPFITIVCLSVILLVKVYSGYGDVKPSPKERMTGKPIPEFEIADLINEKSTLSNADFKNGRIVLNFFSSWCTTCRAENPILLEAAKIKDVRIFGIAWRDKKNDTLTWLSDLGNAYDKVGYDDTGKIGISFGIRGIPETFIINNGVIVQHYVGNLPENFSKKLNEKKYKKNSDS